MTASPMSASPAASPAPSASPQGSPQSAGQPSGGNPQDAGFDVQTAWKEARAARQEAGKLREVFSKQSKDLEGLSEDRDTVRRMREVFAPKKEAAAPDPISGLEEQLDYYLETAMDLKAKGQSIPLTTNLAVQSFQTMIAQQKAIQALTQQITELKGGLDKANNPEAPINNMAYAQMETFMTSAIDGLYGKNQTAKAQIYDATVRLIKANLTELQTKAPQEWDRVRRNPQDLQKIVNSAIKQLVPPKAYSILENEQLQNTPLKSQEVWGAWEELKELRQQGKINPEQFSKMQVQIRRDFLEAQKNERSRRR